MDELSHYSVCLILFLRWFLDKFALSKHVLLKFIQFFYAGSLCGILATHFTCCKNVWLVRWSWCKRVILILVDLGAMTWLSVDECIIAHAFVYCNLLMLCFLFVPVSTWCCMWWNNFLVSLIIQLNVAFSWLLMSYLDSGTNLFIWLL